jgi:hypothetical protein
MGAPAPLGFATFDPALIRRIENLIGDEVVPRVNEDTRLSNEQSRLERHWRPGSLRSSRRCQILDGRRGVAMVISSCVVRLNSAAGQQPRNLEEIAYREVKLHWLPAIADLVAGSLTR